MNTPGRPQAVPTLTEVVDIGQLPPPQAAPSPVAAPVELHGELAERVYADVQRQVDLMLEYRLREVLTPAIETAMQALVLEARIELAATLREVVSRAVEQELARRRR